MSHKSKPALFFRNPHGTGNGCYRVVTLWRGRYFACDWAPNYVPTDPEISLSWLTNRKFWKPYDWNKQATVPSPLNRNLNLNRNLPVPSR